MELDSVNIAPTSETFDFWLSRPFVPPKLQSQLEQANVLFLPVTAPNNDGKPLFAAETRGILEFLQSRGGDIIADVPISDDDFSELVLHGRLIDLGKLIVKWAVAPVLASMLAAYVYERLNAKTPDTMIRCEIIVQQRDGQHVSIKYNGPPGSFEAVLQSQMLAPSAKK